MTPQEVAEMLTGRTSHTEEDVEMLCKTFETMTAEDMWVLLMDEVRVRIMGNMPVEQKNNMQTLNHTLSQKAEFNNAMLRFHTLKAEKQAAAAAAAAKETTP